MVKQREKRLYVGQKKACHSTEKSEEHLLWDTEGDREVVSSLQDKVTSRLHNQFSD